jgi:hypothetical protein
LGQTRGAPDLGDQLAGDPSVAARHGLIVALPLTIGLIR